MSGVLLLAASVGVGGETHGAAGGIRTAGGDYVGSRACGQCHVAEYRHWMDSPHAAAHWQLRSERARRIARRMGLDVESPAGAARCNACHRQPRPDDPLLRVVSEGVGCESCHGAAGGPDGWLNTHASFGPGVRDASQEPPAHRRERRRRCDRAGMRRAEHVAKLAAACVACHTIADADLIDAGHPDGLEFDVAAAIERDIRHNFHHDPRTNALVPSLWASRARQPAGRYVTARRIVGAMAELAAAGRILAEGEPGTSAVRVAWARTAERLWRLRNVTVRTVGRPKTQDPERSGSDPSDDILGGLMQWQRRMRWKLLPVPDPAERPMQATFDEAGYFEDPMPDWGDAVQRFERAAWEGVFDPPGSDRSDASGSPGPPAGDAADRGKAAREPEPGAPGTALHAARVVSAANGIASTARGGDAARKKSLRAWAGVAVCAECHEAEHVAWMRSSHAGSWRALSGSRRAERYVAAVGGSSVGCLRCHAPAAHRMLGIRSSAAVETERRPAAEAFDGGVTADSVSGGSDSSAERRGDAKAEGRRDASIERVSRWLVMGVACEACHGAAGDERSGWIDVHADLTLTRRRRMNEAEDRGLIRPTRLVLLAQRCAACHVVDDPRLVEAGHPAGGDWEFVGWTAGEVRHNLQVDPQKNEPVPSLLRQYGEVRPADRRRRKFLIGVLTNVLRCSALLEDHARRDGRENRLGRPDPVLAAWRARRSLWAATLEQALALVGEAAPRALPVKRRDAAIVAGITAPPDPQAVTQAVERLRATLKWLAERPELSWARPLDDVIDRLPARGTAHVPEIAESAGDRRDGRDR